MPPRPSDRPRLQVEVVRRPSDGAARGLAGWLLGVAPARARGQVTVALVSDQAMRVMNRRYRGVDRPTDVLSFATSDTDRLRWSTAWSAVATAPGATAGGTKAGLGDIAIARGVAARQARAHGHSVTTEVRVLALHGLLHLLGYDHEDARDGGTMARVEARLRRRGGLPAGLIDRRQGAGDGPSRRQRR